VGAFAVGSNKTVAKILDIKALLDTAFSHRSSAKPRERKAVAAVSRSAAGDRQSQQGAATETLVTFDVNGQEFALPLSVVEEILPAPANVTALARAETVVLGITSVRDALLPLLSLRGLLGFAAAARDAANGREKVVVIKLGDARVGLVADQARHPRRRRQSRGTRASRVGRPCRG
jgi:purine-binding chemotaxis protein CheW